MDKGKSIQEEALNFLESETENLRILNYLEDNVYVQELTQRVQFIVKSKKLTRSLEGYGGIYFQSNRVNQKILIPMYLKEEAEERYEKAMEFLKPYHWVFNSSLLKGTIFYSVNISPDLINSALGIYNKAATLILEDPKEKSIRELIKNIPTTNLDKYRRSLAGDLAGTRMAEIVKAELSNEEFHYLILATFLYTLSITQDGDSGILIIGESTIGGVALRTSNKEKNKRTNYLNNFYRRFVRLIVMNEGIYNFEKGNYYRKGPIKKILGDFLKSTCNTFIQNLILSKDITKDALYVDKKGTFFTERIGNKRKGRKENILVIRLYVGSDEAFNFLYHNNAANFAKIENYMNGVLRGYQYEKKRYDEFKKVRIDVYISPKIDDITAMETNPIIKKKKSELIPKIEDESNFWYFYTRHKNFFNNESNFGDFRFVVYLYSELIGPSIYPAELVARIAREGKDCIFQIPIKILDLFSGAGTLNYTIAKQFESMIEKVNILSLDINPCVVDIRPDFKKAFHIVQSDIFSFFDQVYYENETIFSNYDIISADPHHFMVLDFLYKKVQLNKEKIPFFKWLSSNTKVFILYFGHKEKEYMGFFIHRIMSRYWTHMYSLLIGDEKIIIGTNFSKEEKNEKFVKILKKIREEIDFDYEMKARGLSLVIFDTILRQI